MGTLSCYPYPFLLQLPVKLSMGFIPLRILLLCQYDIKLNGLAQSVARCAVEGGRGWTNFPN